MRRALPLGIALLPLACSGEPASPTLGLDQPLRVKNAQFIAGELPGRDVDGGPSADAGASEGAVVTVIETSNRLVSPGQTGKLLGGRTTPGAFAVALRVADQGSGYWLVPVGPPDVTANDEQSWSAEIEFSDRLRTGLFDLALAAVGADGRSGARSLLSLCAQSPVPDNLNACDPKTAPPALVLSLGWDAPVDLDLRVLTPGGKLVDAKAPSTAPLTDAGVDPSALADPSTGIVDHDSGAGCVRDVRRESLVFQQKPAPGRYTVWARLFDSCGVNTVRFRLSAFRPEALPEGAGFRQVEQPISQGAVLGLTESGTAPEAYGTFITQIDLL
jgi:hypothetical protein